MWRGVRSGSLLPTERWVRKVAVSVSIALPLALTIPLSFPLPVSLAHIPHIPHIPRIALPRRRLAECAHGSIHRRRVRIRRGARQGRAGRRRRVKALLAAIPTRLRRVISAATTARGWRTSVVAIGLAVWRLGPSLRLLWLLLLLLGWGRRRAGLFLLVWPCSGVLFGRAAV
ncbi:hypothetical protein C8R43DRAFT_1018312 [Mycena crocata]|nr:hypothetical protein C8R43DRAFT_1018312 [Mycena crocata]